jgi:DNA-binding HxlR family transcriptional regulator
MSTGPAGAPRGTVVTVAAYETCPVTRVLRRIGDKWSPAIIRLLSERNHGFNELDRSIEGISRRMLTRTLRALEEEGFVSRTTYGPAPARVEYSLTELGRSLRDQLFTLGRWATAHTADLSAALRVDDPEGAAPDETTTELTPPSPQAEAGNRNPSGLPQ